MLIKAKFLLFHQENIYPNYTHQTKSEARKKYSSKLTIMGNEVIEALRFLQVMVQHPMERRD